MDISHQSFSQSALNPAYLYVGAESILVEATIEQLQRYFCAQKGCSVCVVCRKVQEQRHESIRWITPEKQYSLEDLATIFATLRYRLEENQQFFFILQKVDTLTIACANALLKSLEEPPAGYQFILHAQRTDLILPTVKSRCIQKNFSPDTHRITLQGLTPFFTATTFQDPAMFLKELETDNPTHWECLSFIDELFTHWSAQYRACLLSANAAKAQEAQYVLLLLKKALSQPPMPGSSKIFLKNLFLGIKSYHK